MRHPSAGIIALALAAAGLQGQAAGQTSAEVRGGVTVGSHSGTAAGMEMAPAAAFEILVLRQLTPLLRLYGGFARAAFGCEEGFCLDRDLTVTGTHGVLGAEAQVSRFWGRVGVLMGKTEVGAQDDADLGPGIHVAAGLILGDGRFRLTPGVSYRWMSAKTLTVSDHAVALGADLGLRVALGGKDDPPS